MLKTLKKKQARIANWIQDKRVAAAKSLAGEAFMMTPTDSVRLAGCIVFWYEQEGYRHYVTVQSKMAPQGDGLVRFPSFFGLMPQKDAAETMRAAIQLQLGQVFAQAINLKSISTDNISAAPTFRWHDKSLGTVDSVQLLVWDMQLSMEQVAQIQATEGFVVRYVPEFAMTGKRISKAHKLIFQSVQQKIQMKARPQFSPTQILEQLDDYLNASQEVANRTIH